MRMSGRILQNREGGKCLREIIVDRENGAKAFVLFELTKGNIAEIRTDTFWGNCVPQSIAHGALPFPTEFAQL